MIIECCGCHKKEDFKDTKKAWMSGWNFVTDKFSNQQVICDSCNVQDALQVVYNKAKNDAFFNISIGSK